MIKSFITQLFFFFIFAFLSPPLPNDFLFLLLVDLPVFSLVVLPFSVGNFFVLLVHGLVFVFVLRFKLSPHFSDDLGEFVGF